MPMVTDALKNLIQFGETARIVDKVKHFVDHIIVLHVTGGWPLKHDVQIEK